MRRWRWHIYFVFDLTFTLHKHRHRSGRHGCCILIVYLSYSCQLVLYFVLFCLMDRCIAWRREFGYWASTKNDRRVGLGYLISLWGKKSKIGEVVKW